MRARQATNGPPWRAGSSCCRDVAGAVTLVSPDRLAVAERLALPRTPAPATAASPRPTSPTCSGSAAAGAPAVPRATRSAAPAPATPGDSRRAGRAGSHRPRNRPLAPEPLALPAPLQRHVTMGHRSAHRHVTFCRVRRPWPQPRWSPRGSCAPRTPAVGTTACSTAWASCPATWAPGRRSTRTAGCRGRRADSRTSSCRRPAVVGRDEQGARGPSIVLAGVALQRLTVAGMDRRGHHPHGTRAPAALRAPSPAFRLVRHGADRTRWGTSGTFGLSTCRAQVGACPSTCPADRSTTTRSTTPTGQPQAPALRRRVVDGPGLRRRVRLRPPAYVTDFTYADLPQEHLELPAVQMLRDDQDDDADGRTPLALLLAVTPHGPRTDPAHLCITTRRHPRERETPGMSTARRRLGTGPTSTRTTPTTETAPRLLAAERADPGPLLGEAGHPEAADRNGRRVLGPRGSSLVGRGPGGAAAAGARQGHRPGPVADQVASARVHAQVQPSRPEA